MRKRITLYAIYKGDRFIDVGTASELSERMGCPMKYIYWLTSPAAHRRAEGNESTYTVAFRVGYEYKEEEE